MGNVIVRDAGKKGKGLFASRNIKQDEQILYFTGKVVETNKQSEYPHEIQEHWHPIDKKGDKTMYVLPEPPWMYLNHSCEPNAGVKKDRYLVAIRDIKKGEEILVDYSTDNIDGWTMKCKCGSRKCRKVISTFDKLSPKDQERLKKYVSSYVKKKYIRGSKKN